MSRSLIAWLCLVVGPVVSFAGELRAQPVITEIFYNPAGGSEVAFEWFEIYNPGPGELAIAGLVVDSRRADSPRLGSVPASAAPLAAGAYAVLASSLRLGVACQTEAPTYVLDGEFALNNSNAAGPDNPRLALFAAGTTDVVNTPPLDIVAYRESGFPSAGDGHAVQLIDVALDNYLGASWRAVPDQADACPPYASSTAGALYGSPGRANGWCAGGSEDAGVSADAGGSPVPVCVDFGVDAGLSDSAPAEDAAASDATIVADDAAVGVDRGSYDAGPQTPPVVTLSEPSSNVSASTPVPIVYAASDADGDALSVALFYDDDDQGYDGVLIVDNLDAVGSYDWQTQGVPAGRYYIFARVIDARGGLGYAYAAGRVTVPAGSQDEPSLEILSPIGGEQVDESYTFTFAHNGVPGTLSFFYDTDASGEDGMPIMGGIQVPGAPDRIQWDTRDLDEGSYYVYGLYQTQAGDRVDYSQGAIQVTHPGGCGCQAQVAPQGMAALFLLFSASAWRRRRGAARR